MLYTEALNHGQDYGGVRAVNPFLPRQEEMVSYRRKWRLENFSMAQWPKRALVNSDMTRTSIELAVKIFLVCLIAVFGWACFGLIKEIGWI